MLGPYKGHINDRCCGSGGVFVHPEKFVEKHGGRIGDIAIYVRESTSAGCFLPVYATGTQSPYNDQSFFPKRNNPPLTRLKIGERE